MKDSYNRDIHYMRISITDRCNLRCKYCMPSGIDKTSMKEILTYEEIIEIVKNASKIGIKYIKITGGEPLVRKGCMDLIKEIKSIPGIEKVTITTNGILLEQYLEDLIKVKIDGINISLDTLDRKQYEDITGFDKLEQVLSSIKKATQYNIPIKINAVSLPNINYHKLIELTKDNPIDLRFIEMMPIGEGKNFDIFNHQQLFQSINNEYHLIKDNSIHGYGPAVYYKINDYKGSIGFISAIHGKFCDSCNRIRLTSQGYLKTCLCYKNDMNLKEILRHNHHDQDILNALKQAIMNKPKAHCFEDINHITEKDDMSKIGG